MTPGPWEVLYFDNISQPYHLFKQEKWGAKIKLLQKKSQECLWNFALATFIRSRRVVLICHAEFQGSE